MKQYEAAYEDWLSGMKYRDIAHKYGVSESTVKSWAARYWRQNAAEKVAKNDKKVAKKPRQKAASAGDSLARPRGAPKGNQNAKGNAGGAPKGNQNALRHGLRASVYWDVLDEDEQALLMEIDLSNEEALLEEQIVMFTLRERRLLKFIAFFKGQINDKSALEQLSKRHLVIKGNFADGLTQEQIQTETTTKAFAALEALLKLEAELTKVQAKKTKAIEDLTKLRLELRKETSDNQKQLVDDWVTALLEGDGYEQ